MCKIKIDWLCPMAALVVWLRDPMVTAAEVVERAAGSGEVPVAPSLWAAAVLAEDGGGLSVDGQSSARRRWIQRRWFRRQS